MPLDADMPGGGQVPVIGNPAGGGGSGAGFDLFSNVRNRTLVIIKNDSAGERQITIPAQTTVRPDDFPGEQWPASPVADITKTIAAGATAIFYHIPNAYNNASGHVPLNYDDVEDMVVQAHEVTAV